MGSGPQGDIDQAVMSLDEGEAGEAISDDYLLPLVFRQGEVLLLIPGI
jgi:hypothetical protein